jgi:hypothetical protein
MSLWFSNPRVRADHDLALVTGAAHAGEQLVDEPVSATLRVRLALAAADVDDLTGVGTGRDDRVISVGARVPVAGALLLIAVDLADEAVQIHDQRPTARTRARLPRPRERNVQHPVELANMPERERAQERPERRGRHHSIPRIRLVDPARSTFMSSMPSAPASIPCTSVITLRPGNDAPGVR